MYTTNVDMNNTDAVMTSLYRIESGKVGKAIDSAKEVLATVLESPELQEKLLADFEASIGERVSLTGNTPAERIEKSISNKDLLFKEATYHDDEVASATSTLTARDLGGNTLMHRAALAGLCRNSNNTIRILQNLSNLGLDLSAKNRDGMTPLHIAATRVSDKVTCRTTLPWLIDEAVEKGFDFNQKDNAGRTVLHVAAETYYHGWPHGPQTGVAPLLAEVPDLDINAVDSFGLTPLSHAILYQNWTAVEELRAAGADLALACKPISAKVGDLVHRHHFEVLFRQDRLFLVDEECEPSDSEVEFPDLSLMNLQQKVSFFHHHFKYHRDEEALAFFERCIEETPLYRVNEQDH